MKCRFLSTTLSALILVLPAGALTFVGLPSGKALVQPDRQAEDSSSISLHEARGLYIRALVYTAHQQMERRRLAVEPLSVEPIQNAEWYQILITGCPAVSGQAILQQLTAIYEFRKFAQSAFLVGDEEPTIVLIQIASSAYERDAHVRDSIVVSEGPLTIQTLTSPEGMPPVQRPSDISDPAIRAEFEARYVAVYERMHAFNRLEQAKRQAEDTKRLAVELLQKISEYATNDRVMEILKASNDNGSVDDLISDFIKITE